MEAPNLHEQLINAQKKQIQDLTEQLNRAQREKKSRKTTNLYEQLDAQGRQIQILTEQLSRVLNSSQEARNLGSEVINIEGLPPKLD